MLLLECGQELVDLSVQHFEFKLIADHGRVDRRHGDGVAMPNLRQNHPGVTCRAGGPDRYYPRR